MMENWQTRPAGITKAGHAPVTGGDERASIDHEEIVVTRALACGSSSDSGLLAALTSGALRTWQKCLIAMLTKTFNDVVRLAFASTPRELLDALAPLPHGVRYGVACDLEDGGTAHRYDNPSERAYYLCLHDRGFLVWRWNYVASYEEAGRLLAMVNSLGSELNGEIASRIFSRATRRPIELPVPELEPRPIPNTTRMGFA